MDQVQRAQQMTEEQRARRAFEEQRARVVLAGRTEVTGMDWWLLQLLSSSMAGCVESGVFGTGSC